MAGAAIGIRVFRAMATKAAAHADIGFAPKTVARGDGAMTGFAGRIGIEMSFVAELDEAGDLVDADPGHGLVFIDVGFQILDRGAVFCNLPVAGHTALAGGNGNNLTGRGKFVTVVALEMSCFGMLFMTEWNGLANGGGLRR